MSTPLAEDGRLADLLAQRESEGLSPGESRELESLLASAGDLEPDALAPAAAAATLALRLPVEPMPEWLQSRLIEGGRAALIEARATSRVKSLPRPPARAAASGSLGWYAAAAALLLAVGAWWPKLSGQPQLAGIALPRAPGLAEQRAALLASGDRVIVRSWTGTKDPADEGLTGDVVWDPATQTGYMRFTGLAPNDASVQEYQLWIFDATRDERYPVDGGVFDVPAGNGPVIVPIHARLPVHQAAMFAVTVEQPGGVVVSSRQRIVALAQVATS